MNPISNNGIHAFCTYLGSMTFDCGPGASGWAAVSLDEGWTRVGSALPPTQDVVLNHSSAPPSYNTIDHVHLISQMEECPLWIVCLQH